MHIGEVVRIQLPAFYVIGKEGKGLSADSSSWVPPLWELTVKDFAEIEAFVPKKEERQFWGLMSDGEKWLQSWEETGRYLAGIQAADLDTAILPHGWVRWQMPAMEYMVLKTNEKNLDMMTEKMLNEILPKQYVFLAAAIQERYLPDFEEGEVELFFPITRHQ